MQALIESFEAQQARRDTTHERLRHIILLADLSRALDRLYATYWSVVLVHGLLGYSQEETASLLQISQQAVSKRYKRGLEETTHWINGGYD